MAVYVGERCRCFICRNPVPGSKCDHQLLIEAKRDLVFSQKSIGDLRAKQVDLEARAAKCDVLAAALVKIVDPYMVDGVAHHWSANRMREIAMEALEATK